MNKPPVKIKDYVDVHIESLNSEGQGVGRINGYVIFVIGALSGEDCKAQIVKATSKYAVARLIRYKKPSKLREEPLCPYFCKCGGCQLQHIKYPAQLLFKQNKVIQALSKIAGIKKDVVSPTIGMVEPWYYRNKSIFTAANGAEHPVLGMYQNHSHKVLDIDKCYIANKKINTILTATKDWMKRSKVTVHDNHNKHGDLRAIYARVGVATGQAMVGAVTYSDNLPGSDTFTTLLRRSDNDIVSIFHNVNTKPKGERLSFNTDFIWGTKTIADKLGKLRFDISPYSFYQVNPIQTKKLYDTVVDFCELEGHEKVLDAYCGVGTIGQYLASNCNEVKGIESINDAINDAKDNARKNNIRNTKYLVGDCAIVLPQLIDAGLTFDIVVVDPPRKGCDKKFIQSLITAMPPKIVYVSCNPSTMARDIKELANNGYDIIKVQPVDMFPQTDHVETVVQLQHM